MRSHPHPPRSIRSSPKDVRFPCVHAVATTPAQRPGSLLLTRPVVSAFPEMAVGSACATSFSRLARRSLTLRPAHSRCHHIRGTLHRRLQPLCYLHSRSGCFRLELFSRVEFSPTGKAPPQHGARQQQPYPRMSLCMFTLFDPEKQQEEDRSNRQMDNLRIDGLEVDEKCRVHQ